MAKLTDITAFSGTLADEDLIHIVDVSDTTQDPAGSSYKLPLSELASAVGGSASPDVNEFDPVISILNTPAVGPATGDRYLVGTVPTGAWVGNANNIAEWDGATWVYTSAIADYYVFLTSTLLTYRFNGSIWIASSAVAILQNGNKFGAVGMRIGTNDAAALLFKTNNVLRGLIDANGNFSFGFVSSASARLHVISTTEQLRIGYNTTNYFKTTVGSTGAVAYEAVGTGSSYDYRYTGIGNSFRLTEIGTGGTLIFRASGSTGYAEIVSSSGLVLDTSVGEYSFRRNTSGRVLFYVGGSSTRLDISGSGSGAAHLTLLSTGEIGINNTSPSAQLHIIKTTEQLRVGYDASNYLKFTVSSTGQTTFSAIGSSPLINMDYSGSGHGLAITETISGAVFGIRTKGSTGTTELVSTEGFSFLSAQNEYRFGAASATRALIYVNSPANALALSGSTIGTPHIYILADGKMGFGGGISSPSALMHVVSNGTTSATYAMKVWNNSFSNLFSIKDDGNMSMPLVQIGNAGLASGDLYFDTAANALANGDKILIRKT